MRIVYDHQIFGWQRFGGVSRYFYELARNMPLISPGDTACRITAPLYVNDYVSNNIDDLDVIGIKVPIIRGTGRIYRAFNRQIVPMLLNKWHPDVVHETYYSRQTVAPKRCKTVLTVFDMIHELYPADFASWDQTAAEKKIAVSRADHIICISENTRKDLLRLFDIPIEKTTVIHLGFSLTTGDLPPSTLASRPFILFVGSRGGYKNFDKILEVYAENRWLSDHFDLVAFGGGRFSLNELARISALKLVSPQVRHVSGDDLVLADLYQQASLFVYPSLYEGFGIPPLEAMSFGCPVVCSNTSSMPEVVGDAALKFDPTNKDSIAEAIEKVLDDATLQLQLKELGRQRLARFSWHKCAVDTLDVYKKVLQ